MFKNMRIGAKLIIVGALILLIPLGVVGVISVVRSTQGLVNLEHEQLTSRTAELASSSEELASQADQLKTTIEFFKIDTEGKKLLTSATSAPSEPYGKES